MPWRNRAATRVAAAPVVGKSSLLDLFTSALLLEESLTPIGAPTDATPVPRSGTYVVLTETMRVYETEADAARRSEKRATVVTSQVDHELAVRLGERRRAAPSPAPGLARAVSTICHSRAMSGKKKKSGGGSSSSGRKSGSGSSSGRGTDRSGRIIEKKQPKGPVTGSAPRPPKPSTGDLGPDKKS